MTRRLGAVLAGGRSSRFGSDKAQAFFGGTSLLDRAHALIAPWCDEVVVIGRDGGVPDLPHPGLGPLGGIAGALDHAASRDFPCVLTIGCDMPVLPDGLIDALLAQAPAYCPDAPVLGNWPAALGAQVLAHVSTSPDRSIRRWAASIGAIAIPAADGIANVNTPADLLAL